MKVRHSRPAQMIFFLVLFLCNSPLFLCALSTSEFNQKLASFAKTMSYELPVMSSIGLNWSDAYVGQLKDYPEHYGWGFTMAAAVYKEQDLISAMMPVLQNWQKPYFMGRYILPVWTFEARLGGLLGIPFDFGMKIGGIPSNALLHGVMTFSQFNAGVDIRNRIFKAQYALTELSIGFGMNFIAGKMHGSNPTATYILSDLATSGVVLDTEFSASVYNFKIILSQPVMRSLLTVFFTIDIGYFDFENFWKISPVTGRMFFPSFIVPPTDDWLSGGTCELYGPIAGMEGYKITWKEEGLSLVLQFGLGREFSNGMRIDFSVVTTPFNMEFTPSINIRKQM